LFSLAILAGLSLVFMGVRYHCSSLALGLVHAGIALTALILLIVYIAREAGSHMLYNNAAFLFLLALVGGIVLLVTRNNKKSAPLPIVIAHASLALIALALLIKVYIQS
jgi:hypothetical protein